MGRKPKTDLKHLTKEGLEILASTMAVLKKILNNMRKFSPKTPEELADYQKRMSIVTADVSKVSNALKGLSHERRQVEESYKEAAKKLTVEEKIDVMLDFFRDLSKSNRRSFFKQLMAPLSTADRREMALQFMEVGQRIEREEIKNDRSKLVDGGASEEPAQDPPPTGDE